MKKSILAIVLAFVLTNLVSACPEWECNLDLNDYSCGGVHSCSSYSYTETYTYNETSARQPIYCQYCGHEQWDCICGTYSGSVGCIDYDYDYDCSGGCINYDDYDYDYGCIDYGCSNNYSYSCGGSQMSHWANIRDCYGNIIGQAGCGDSIEVVGIDSCNPDRVLIYDYSTGCYGSVLSSCVYGGYQWDGTGDNGYYNSYQGGGSNYNCNYDCNDYGYQDYGCIDYDYDYSYQDCSYSGGSCYGVNTICAAYSTTTYTQIVQTIVEQVTYSLGFGNYSYGCSYGRNLC